MIDKDVHVVLDLETMGNTQSAAIAAIGAVACTVEQGIFSQFYTEVSLDSSVRHGLSMDVSTVLWWLNQDKDARAIFQHNHKVADLTTAIIDFDNWFRVAGEPKGIRVWGNGADFDNAILRNAYQHVGRELPWMYYNNRCLRTLRAENPDVAKPAFVGTPHHAGDDARNQAEHLLLIKRKGLYGANPTGALRKLT